jgi:putative MATE family efflux protein
MAKNKRVDITQGPVNTVLRKLAAPMILGILGMVAFNLADTYFVGKLGTFQIAALSFTFPVVMVVGSINMGIGIGTSAVISKAVGEKQKEKVIRLSTDSLTLGLLISLITITAGLLTIRPLFALLGADSTTMPYIQEYMSIWYLGVPFVVIPMIGNNVIRALGDTKTPSIVMLVAAGVNIVLDPLLIFGIGFFPKMGVTGAALATVIARAFTFAFALYILVKREKVISLKRVKIVDIAKSWGRILFIGLPNAIAKTIIPLGTGVITGLIAVYGAKTVAGYGIATKIEFFAISVVRALIAVIPVFVGQNFGAKNIERIKKGFLSSEKFSVLNGIVLYAVLAIFARPISQLFTSDDNVINTIVLYVRIVPLGYAFLGILQIINGTYNALHKPIKAAGVNLIQMLVIYIPLAIVTSKLFGINAIFISLVASYIIVGIIAHLALKKDLNKLATSLEE